jgi:hypothetical protein
MADAGCWLLVAGCSLLVPCCSLVEIEQPAPKLSRVNFSSFAFIPHDTSSLSREF